MEARKTLNLVQVLRGIASLLVVLMHATMASRDIFSIHFLGGIFAFGGAGVDIFFVLSGFIITYTSRQNLGNSSKFVSFLKRRFIRIFPAYWIIITGFLMVQLLLPAYYKTPFTLTLPNFLKTYFLLPNHEMINGVSWTLTYELFFYILFSVAFLIKNKIALWILSSAYVLSLIIFAAAHPIDSSTHPWLQLVFFPMNVEFFLGILAARLVLSSSGKAAVPLIILGSALFTLSAILSYMDIVLMHSGFDRVVHYGVPAFFIITGVVLLEVKQHVRTHNILLALGSASYSLYLIHLPVLVAALSILHKFAIFHGVVLQAAVLALVLSICAFSIFFFQKIEAPLIKKLSGKL